MKKESIIRLFIVSVLALLFLVPLKSQYQHPTNEGFGYKLREMRESYRISVKELAKYTGLDRTYLEGIESGKYAVGAAESKIISEYFGQEF